MQYLPCREEGEKRAFARNADAKGVISEKVELGMGSKLKAIGERIQEAWQPLDSSRQSTSRI
jgi:hypothetical protein